MSSGSISGVVGFGISVDGNKVEDMIPVRAIKKINRHLIKEMFFVIEKRNKLVGTTISGLGGCVLIISPSGLSCEGRQIFRCASSFSTAAMPVRFLNQAKILQKLELKVKF